jgi:hypothetical protein
MTGIRTKDSPNPEGMAPFRDGHMAFAFNATGVCTDLIDLAGHLTDLASSFSIVTHWKDGVNRKNLADQNKYNQYIAVACAEHNVDPVIFKSLLMQESDFRPTIANKHGFVGIAQMNKDAAKIGGLKVDGGVDERTNPAKAIPAGVNVFVSKRKAVEPILDKFGVTKAGFERYKFYLASYNLGEGTVKNACKKAAKQGLTWDQVTLPSTPTQSPLYKAIEAAHYKGFTPAQKYQEGTGYVAGILKRAFQ